MSRFLKLFIPVVAVVLLVAFFAFFDNKTSAQTLICANAQSDVIHTLDRSGSMSDSAGGGVSKMKAAKTASKNFVDIFSGDTRNRVGVVSYSVQAGINQELTGDYQKAKDAISSLSPDGRTCIECGVYKSNLAIKQKGRNGVKNVVILLTDGKANVVRGSNDKVGTNLAESKALAEVNKGHAENGTVYFTIGLGKDINADFLKEIASVTGGKYYSSPSTDQLNNIYQQISQIIAEGSISGVVYNDENKNGTQDEDEDNLDGWTVRLAQDGFPTKSLVTDDSGGYVFGGLCDGAYKVSESLKSGWEQTEPTTPEHSINLSGGATLTNTNFGNVPAPSPTSVPACVKNPPTLEVTPDTVTGEAGVEQVFDVKITNNDSKECSPSDFDISGVIYNYPLWDVTLDQSEFTLNPGGTGNTKMRVTPPSGAQDGPITITVIAKPTDGPQISQNVRYIVDNPEITPIPATPTNIPNTPTEIPATPTDIPVTPAPQCVKNIPLLEVIGEDYKLTTVDTPANYNLRVTNQNSSECDSGNFNISGNPENFFDINWSFEGTDGPPFDNFTISSGESRDIALTLITNDPTAIGKSSIFDIRTTEVGSGLISEDEVILSIEGPATLNVTIGADGIGTTPRIPLGGNKNPLHPNRNYLVSIFDATDNSPKYSGEQTFIYNPIDQKFESSFKFMPDDISGIYNIFVEGPQYLRAQLPGSVNVRQGDVVDVRDNNFNFIAGDINKIDQSFNSIDLLDYNVLISCSIYAQSSAACEQDANYLALSDLNDDGLVDEDDYTLWLKELANQPGANLPTN